MKKKAVYLAVSKLRVGLFVDLELGWSEHPFLFSKFKIKQDSDIAQIRKLGLTKIKVLIGKSNPQVLKALSNKEKVKQEDVFAIDLNEEVDDDLSESLDDMWQQKEHSLNKADAYRKQHRKTAQRYKETQKRVNNAVRNLRMAPANAIRDAEDVITDITGLLADQGNVVVSMVSLTQGEFNLQNHALNVTILSLMLAKSMNLSKQEIHDLGVAAILHDIGKILIPQAILHKTTPLTSSEQSVLKTHVNKGLAMLSRVKEIAPETLEVIANHHVYLDGTGYPELPQSGELSVLCRILQVANHYDGMCNPRDVTKSVSPKIAMANLFSNYDGKLDNYYIHQFVRNFGVYPPGSIVKLSDDSIALVSSVDSDSLLTPTVIVYNPDIPAHQSLMINLADHDDLTIVKALKVGDFSSEISEYLGVEDRIGYFFSTPGS